MKIRFIIIFVFFYSSSFSQLHLSAIFNDHMVLQRDKPVKIWGAAKAGDEVMVSIGEKKDLPSPIKMADGCHPTGISGRRTLCPDRKNKKRNQNVLMMF